MNEKLTELFAKILQIDSSQIGPECSPETIDTWDSLKQMSLVVAVEEEFGVQFDDDEIFNLDSFAAFEECLGKKI